MSRTSAFRAVVSEALPNNYGIMMEYVNKAVGVKEIKKIVLKPAPLDDSILQVNITKYAKWRWNGRVDRELHDWVSGMLNGDAMKKIEKEGEKAVLNLYFDSKKNELQFGIKDYRNNLKRDW